AANSTAAVCAALTTTDTTTSHCAASSAALAHAGPPSRAKAAATPSRASLTKTSASARRSDPAMPEPIAPRPITPTRRPAIDGAFIEYSSLRVVCRRIRRSPDPHVKRQHRHRRAAATRVAPLAFALLAPLGAWAQDAALPAFKQLDSMEARVQGCVT